MLSVMSSVHLLDKNGAELLFNHLSLRCGRKSTIITTNLSFDRWGEIFGDPVLTAAMVDRLTHRLYDQYERKIIPREGNNTNDETMKLIDFMHIANLLNPISGKVPFLRLDYHDI